MPRYLHSTAFVISSRLILVYPSVWGFDDVKPYSMFLLPSFPALSMELQLLMRNTLLAYRRNQGWSGWRSAMDLYIEWKGNAHYQLFLELMTKKWSSIPKLAPRIIPVVIRGYIYNTSLPYHRSVKTKVKTVNFPVHLMLYFSKKSFISN